jgi:hypothetical protein
MQQARLLHGAALKSGNNIDNIIKSANAMKLGILLELSMFFSSMLAIWAYEKELYENEM